MKTRMKPLTRADLASFPTLKSWARQLAQLLQKAIVEPHFTATVEATNAREVSIQLQDRLGRNVVGRWPIDLWITTVVDGAPDATGNTVLVLTGTQLSEYTANAAYRLLTDETGLAKVRITIVGTATRYVYATAGGESLNSGALDWA